MILRVAEESRSLQAYKEDGQITLEDIEEVVPKTLR